MTPEQKAEVEGIFEDFLRNRAKKLRNIRLRDLDINPFLVRLLQKDYALSDAASVLRWALQQHFERGTVTGFGTALQKVAKLFSEGTGAEGADLLKRKGTQRYYIQVKSGPNTVPKDLARALSEHLQSVRRRNQGSVALYAMCYGHPERVSAIVRNPKYMTIDWYVGRAFWEFISDDAKTIDEIYEIANEVSSRFVDMTRGRFQGKSLRYIYDEKFLELTTEFKGFYRESGSEMWDNLLKHNS